MVGVLFVACADRQDEDEQLGQEVTEQEVDSAAASTETAPDSGIAVVDESAADAAAYFTETEYVPEVPRGGVRWKVILGILRVGWLLAPVAWTQLADYQRERIMTVFQPLSWVSCWTSIRSRLGWTTRPSRCKYPSTPLSSCRLGLSSLGDLTQ